MIPKKLPNYLVQGWLARHAAIKAILHQYDALKLHFELAKEKDRCYTAELLYDMYHDEKNLFSFLSSILSKVTAINKLFQSDNVDPLKLFDDLMLYSLLQKIVIPQHLKKKTRRQNLEHFELRQYLMSTNCLNLGYEFNLTCAGRPPQNVKNIMHRSILSLPCSNASDERMFLIINIVKDKLRNKMFIKTKTILHLRDNLPDGCINFAPSKEMIRKFNSENMYSSNFVEDVLETFAE
ncbi:PREDICTED: uncharacterized protein LOC105148626 [Acromyrmex echinatior]|uniref:uncharacterized protein LOC105148626 n=1 Tax=Acromyrmex echinatior TaxID=103372 RepID=UPI000580EBC7|nr:PREDICTED: uncharacterized protein LOC105148626 [Acromyrmex echinatior]